MYEEEIDGVLEELTRLVGTPLAQVWQPARDRVVLGWRDGTLLLMVPRGPLARFHTIAERPNNPVQPFSFQGVCRARLRGSLRALARAPGERVVRWTWDAGSLELRLTGRSGGLFLLDQESVVASLDGPAPSALPPLPHRGESRGGARFRPEPGGSWDLVARSWFQAREEADRLASLRERARKALGRALERNLRLLDHLHQDLARAEGAPELRRRAELLAAHLYRFRDGARSVQVEDWETGAPMLLTLPPDLPSAPKALDRWFGQARRLERAADHVLTRIDQVESTIRALRSRLDRFDSLPPEDLAELGRALPREDRRRPAEVARLPWDEWTGPRGEKVRIGRNEAGNRRLVFQASRGHDWWMHLRDRPSAHAVLSFGRDAAPTLDQLLAAAQLLMLRSSLAPGEPQEVQYTRVRHLRAVPGQGATVQVSDERVLRVEAAAAAPEGWTRGDD